MTNNPTRAQRAAYERVVAVEPRVQPIVALVDALCVLTRPEDQMCSSCAWETIVKPLCCQLFGDGRGFLPEQARPEGAPVKPLSICDFLELADRRTPAENPTEEWLRSWEAWDGFTKVVLARLRDADPANGHGIKGGHLIS